MLPISFARKLRREMCAHLLKRSVWIQRNSVVCGSFCFAMMAQENGRRLVKPNQISFGWYRYIQRGQARFLTGRAPESESVAVLSFVVRGKHIVTRQQFLDGRLSVNADYLGKKRLFGAETIARNDCCENMFE
jgi:hypothetical protein